MCGIYGKVRLDGRPADPGDAELACDGLRSRGPDDRGVYVDGPACLGHTRLSIIDLSSLGHQPMGNEDDTLWIVFNGEIYNFCDLRPGLEAKGYRFRSKTDTEVVLHLYEEEGPGCVERLRGMFAFAIWDGKDRSLFLARDRVGKKPLFYHHGNGFFSFCSALAPLVADPELPTVVDRAAIHHYLTFQSVPAPMTAFAGVRKLPPGHWLRLREGREEVRRYWKLSFAPKFPADTPGRRAGLEDRLFEEIRSAVRIRLLSDVPLGALLSGGVDSSGVVALMAGERPDEPVKTFTVGFREKEYDELRFAREVSRICGTEHRETIVSPEASSVLPLLVERFGEPFADSSAIPMYHITKAAREHVTVALCGDGGDENFAGYFRYKLNRLLGAARVVPPFLSRGAAALLRRLPHAPSIHSPLWISKRLVQAFSLPPGVRNIRFYGHFDPETKRALYTPEFAAEVSSLDSDEIALARFRETDADNLLDATLYADIHTYLPDTLLPKVDVTSMANSMEIRSPLLDTVLMEFAARLPADFKLRRLTAKYALRKAFGRVLPERLFRRPKRGFGVPLDQWFRTELKGTVRELLLSPRTLRRGFFREEAVRRMLEEQEKNIWQWHHHLYNLMMLEMWHRRFIDTPIFR